MHRARQDQAPSPRREQGRALGEAGEPMTPTEILANVLTRIVERTMIANAIHFGDFPRAERLIRQHVDGQVSAMRSAA